jgi:hypothetical protein
MMTTYPDRIDGSSPWDSETAQDTAQYLTDWLAHHNHSTDMGRW